jgi:hypothetical protein
MEGSCILQSHRTLPHQSSSLCCVIVCLFVCSLCGVTMRSGFVNLSWTEPRRSGISYLVPPPSLVTNNHLECTMCVNRRTGCWVERVAFYSCNWRNANWNNGFTRNQKRIVLWDTTDGTVIFLYNLVRNLAKIFMIHDPYIDRIYTIMRATNTSKFI